MKKSLRRAAACLVATLMTMAAVVAGMGAIPAASQQSSLEQPDNYTWLEDIHGERQMAWVKAENARTAAVLEKDSHFAPLEAEALKVLESPDRLPDPQFRNGAGVQHVARCRARAGNRATHHAQGLSDGRAEVGDGARLRCAVQEPTSRVGWVKVSRACSRRMSFAWWRCRRAARMP